MIDININDEYDVIDTQDDLSIYIQEIIMVLNTEPREIMGCTGMSVDLERLIYETKIDNQGLKREIESKIAQYTTLYDRFPTQVDVQFAKGNLRDICLIDIVINSEKMMSIVMK